MNIRTSRFLSIYIVNISKDPDSPRPALVMQFIRPKRKFRVLEITHKNPRYKSNKFSNNYYHLEEWSQENLKYNSWVNTNNLVAIPDKQIIEHMPIGRLTPLDQTRLFKFMVMHLKFYRF